jgi:CBS domain-containing protein
MRRGKEPTSAKKPSLKKHEGEIMQIAQTHIVAMAPTTRIYDAIQTMSKEGFRRIPIVSAGTKTLEGIVTATDIVDYLGGGSRYQIIEQRFGGDFFKAINEPTKLIMTKKVFSIKINTNVSDAIRVMKEKNVGGIPVIDDDSHVKAIITERDIANLFANRIAGVPVSQLMSENVSTASPTTTIFEIEKTMTTKGFRRLPIISDSEVIGMITAMDIIRFFGSGRVFEYLRSGTIVQVLNTPALEIASEDVSTIEPSADIGEAAKIMRDKDIGSLPVVEKGNLVGILTERDFFKVIE